MQNTVTRTISRGGEYNCARASVLSTSHHHRHQAKQTPESTSSHSTHRPRHRHRLISAVRSCQRQETEQRLYRVHSGPQAVCGAPHRTPASRAMPSTSISTLANKRSGGIAGVPRWCTLLPYLDHRFCRSNVQHTLIECHRMHRAIGYDRRHTTAASHVPYLHRAIEPTSDNVAVVKLQARDLLRMSSKRSMACTTSHIPHLDTILGTTTRERERERESNLLLLTRRKPSHATPRHATQQ